MLKKIKTFLKDNERGRMVEKAVAPMLAAGAALGLVPTVYADPLDTTMGSIVGFVLNIFRYIGIILSLWGIGALIMAFKNEDADSKSRAIMSLVVGLALVTLKSLITGAGLDDALGITIP